MLSKVLSLYLLECRFYDSFPYALSETVAKQLRGSDALSELAFLLSATKLPESFFEWASLTRYDILGVKTTYSFLRGGTEL